MTTVSFTDSTVPGTAQFAYVDPQCRRVAKLQPNWSIALHGRDPHTSIVLIWDLAPLDDPIFGVSVWPSLLAAQERVTKLAHLWVERYGKDGDDDEIDYELWSWYGHPSLTASERN